MPEEEILLSGGNVTPVVRIGDTVHRMMNAWSPAVHDLLRYLELQGFTGAPRFLGIDAQGREVLTFIPGEMGDYPLKSYIWSDEVLVEVARLLRRFHDITASYAAPEGANWQFTFPEVHRHEVICHNDVAPYNMVFASGKPVALIDFDTAGPGPRIWDVAYAAYRFVPISYATDMQAQGLAKPALQARRLRLFCETYGSMLPEQVLEIVEDRVQSLCATLIERAGAGDYAYQRMIDEGHLAHYQREVKALRLHRADLEQNL